MLFLLIVNLSLVPCASAANFNRNAIGITTGVSYLSSAVDTTSANVDVNSSDKLTGLQFLRYFNSENALEIGFFNYGTVELTGASGEQFFTQDNQRVDLANDALFRVNTRGVAVSGLFRNWLSYRWAAQVSLGLQHWRRDVEYRNLINNPQWPQKKISNSILWSLGMVFALGDLQTTFSMGSAHFGDDAIMHSQLLRLSLDYGF